MIQLVLIYCLVSGSACVERRPTYEEPLSLMACMTGGQRAGAELLAENPVLARDYRLTAWRCEVGHLPEKSI